MSITTDPRKTGVAAGMTLLASSAVAASVTGTLTETTLATVTVPAGAMGLNGGLEIHSVWSCTNSANTKTPRVYLGGTGGADHLATGLTATTVLHDVRRIRNRNSAASQVGGMSNVSSGGGVGVSGTAVRTSTINTATAQDVVFTAQLTNTGETVTLESYEVWLLP